MSESDDFSKVVANKLQPYAWLIGFTVSGVGWVAKTAWEGAAEVRDVQAINTKQTKDIAECLAGTATHMKELKESERRHAFALQAIFDQQDLIMDMSMEKLPAKRKRHYAPRIKVQRKAALKLIYSIPVPKDSSL